MIKIVIFATLAFGISPQNKTQVRKPSTVSAFESLQENESEKKNRAVYFEVLAQRYYSIFKPDLDGYIQFEEKLKPYLPKHLQSAAEQRARIYKMLKTIAINENLDNYSAAQRILSMRPQKLEASEFWNFDFIALVLIESYFQTAASPSESAWIFRMNLRGRVYPDHEFSIISQYLERFPRGQQARLKAKQFKDYLENDYRPLSQDADLETFDVQRELKKIKKIMN